MFPYTEETFFKQRLREDINLLIICVYKFYIKNTFLHIITNEMIFYLVGSSGLGIIKKKGVELIMNMS